jgi:hypothetical protein
MSSYANVATASPSASFGAVVAQFAAAVRREFAGWVAARRQAKADEQLWQVALTDARVMADLTRNVNLSARAQRLMRSY